jgi:pentose-5-phosphate-3-epimerase/putative flippase GtrA
MLVRLEEWAAGVIGAIRSGVLAMIVQTKPARFSQVAGAHYGGLASRSVNDHGPALERLQFAFIKTAWRYRYFLSFMVFGFLSILLEVVLVQWVLPTSWPSSVNMAIGFLSGMMFAYVMNASFSFTVPRRHFWQAFGLFALISLFSYSLNYLVISGIDFLNGANYPLSRFVAAGCLFIVAYQLHRRLTFRHFTRNLGLAVYANAGPDLQLAHERIGDLCDHIHMDLIDETMKPGTPPVDLEQVAAARALWRWHPIGLHIMSKTPLKWLEECHPWVDQVLVHADADDDLMEVITRCRQYGLKVGVVWHHTIAISYLMAYLPHVDYVMILGIEKPGCSGQPVMDEALLAADFFASMATRYGYELIFDGGVTADNLESIAAPIVVSSSHVLKAKSPVLAALSLMAGGGHV